jgi:hypothetical protein
MNYLRAGLQPRSLVDYAVDVLLVDKKLAEAWSIGRKRLLYLTFN